MNTDSDAPKPATKVAKRPAIAGGPAREARLKSALKANMARRKAQARARDGAAQVGAADHEAAAPDENDNG